MNHTNFLGVLFAVIFFLASLEPSLLPRPWYLQVVVSVIVCVIAYGIGAFVAWTVRMLVPQWQASPRLRDRAWRSLLILGILFVSFQLVRGAIWQRDTYTLIGMPQPKLNWLTVTVGIFFFTLLFAWLAIRIISTLLRLIDRIFDWFRSKPFTRYVHIALLRSLLAGAVVALVILAINDTSARILDNLTENLFASRNNRVSASAEPPTDPLKSGSPASLVAWKNLGYQGRNFVTGAPTSAAISAVTGKPAMDPIRAYVGLEQTGGNIHEAAKLAVKELERTGAFDRQVLLIVVTTGTGWVDAGSTRPLEYLTNGNIATVATQYSYYPSWLSFLKDKQRVIHAGEETIGQVTAAVAALPPGAHHPKIYLFGESLGSFGTESAIVANPGLTKNIAGTVLVGPPGFNPLHNVLTSQRNPHSPSYDPVVNNQQYVAFATKPQELSRLHTQPKLIYFQNPTDPVTKWNTRLLWDKPDWLNEEKHAGLIAPQFLWVPIVTFFQVTVDMILARTVPPGYGHMYGTNAEAAWQILIGTHLNEQQRSQISADLHE